VKHRLLVKAFTEGEDALEDFHISCQILLPVVYAIRQDSHFNWTAERFHKTGVLTSSTATMMAFASPGSSP
jgi:hypothetical protein